MLSGQSSNVGFLVNPQVMPQYKHGTMKEWVGSIYEQLKFPPDVCFSGTVSIISFIINEEGKVESPEIVRSVHMKGIDEQLIEIVCDAEFIPGKMHGKAVPIKYILPIRFELE